MLIGIDLFAGGGFMGLGFKQAGFTIPVAIEFDASHAAAHRRNFPETKVINKDIRQATAHDIRHAAGLGPDTEIAVVFGGPPCQGFSIQGKNKLADPRRSLPFQFIRIVEGLRPAHFVFENVKGLTLPKNRAVLQRIIAGFSAAGYTVAPWQVLNAKDYGVAQHRERLFLLGSRSDRALLSYPSSTSTLTCKEAIHDLLNPGVAAKLTGNKRCKHSPKLVARFAATPLGSIEPISKFKRLHPDGIAPTLLAGTTNAAAKAAGKGGRFSPKKVIHYAEPRSCTVRELARLHGIPDWVEFGNTIAGPSQRIGNSVPPPLARAVALEVAKAYQANIQTSIAA